MVCLPRPKLFRRHRDRDNINTRPNIVQQFFTSLVVLVTSCVSSQTTDRGEEEGAQSGRQPSPKMDSATRQKIAQRIIKKNKIRQGISPSASATSVDSWYEITFYFLSFYFFPT